jgi:hypothetical protein
MLTLLLCKASASSLSNIKSSEHQLTLNLKRNMKTKRIMIKKRQKIKINPKIKKAWDYSVAVFCIANNGSYFLSQKELLQWVTKDIYSFSKNKAKKMIKFQRDQRKKIEESVIKIPKNLSENISKLMKKIR